MQLDNWPENGDYLRFLAGKSVSEFTNTYGNGFNPGTYDYPASQILNGSPFHPWDVSEITETPQARALAASKNHKEAEKRRRERINSHLDTLRRILPCNSKIDKATLLAKAVLHMRELKKQASDLIHPETFPSETDEISINNVMSCDDNKIMIKASLCCEDRSDLISDLIETLRSLRLSPLSAEIATLGGRVRSILVISGDKDQSDDMAIVLRGAFKGLLQRSSGVDFRDGFKRRRVMNASQANS